MNSAPVSIPGLISVIMPCYNAAAYVAQAVDCVLGQTWGNVELIVVDDGSKDRSPEILRGYGERIRYLEQTNQGPYPARNQGLRYASGEFIAFLDADDWWEPECLEKLHAALSAQPDAALAYCGWQNVGLSGARGEPYVPPDYEAEGKLDRFLHAASPWPIHAALVRSEVMKRAGGFDTHWPTCMDYDLWLRIGATHPIVRVPEVLAYYRFHQSGQITATQWRQAKNTWLVKKKFLGSHPQVASLLSVAQRRDLVDGALLRRGFDLYWKRDLLSAQKVFRLVFGTGAWKLRELKYLLPALLPTRLYLALIGSADGS